MYGLKIYRWDRLESLLGDYYGEAMAVAASKEEAIELIVGQCEGEQRYQKMRDEMQATEPGVKNFVPFGQSRLGYWLKEKDQ